MININQQGGVHKPREWGGGWMGGVSARRHFLWDMMRFHLRVVFNNVSIS